MTEYDIHLDDKFGHLTAFDVDAEAAAHEPRFNQTLTPANDAGGRPRVIQGEVPRHKHAEDDALFLVLDGVLLIDVEGRDTVRLERHQGYTVPRGVMHRTRAPGRTTILMVEPAGVRPTGD